MANIDILNLPVAVAVDGSEWFPGVQGETTKRFQQSLISGGVAGSVQSANTVFAGPSSGSAAAPTFRAVVLADLPTITPAKGGTGLTSYTIGDLLYASASTTLASLADIATGNVLLSGGVGTAPSYGKVGLTTHVSGILPAANGGTGNGFTEFSGPTTSTKTFALPDASATILTTNTVVTPAQGGTGIASYTIGDIIYASGTTTLSKLADVATGNALISGGVGTAPSWGKIGLTTHISGTLAVGNGGTGLTAGTSGGIPYFSSTSTIASSASLTADAIVKGGGAGVAPLASGWTINSSNVLTGPNAAEAVVKGGLQAYRSTASQDGVVIGYFAGTNDTSDSINIGFFAGAGDGVVGAPSGDQPIRIGRHAGYVSNAGQSVIMGHAACQYTGGIVCPTSDVSNAVILGHYAFRNQVQYDPVYAFGAVLIGADVAASARAMQNSVVLGTFAAETTQDGTDACIIGMWAGRNAINCAHSVMMGRYAGKDATNAQQSVLLGYQAGMSLSRNHTLVIESNGTYAPGGTGALIYGEFDNRVLNFNGFTSPQSLGRGAPVTKTADFTVAATENWLINNKSGSSCTVTLPSASSFTGREIMINNYQAQTVVSASSNVVPVAGGAAGTAILAATAGKWAVLVSDGTNWVMMATG